MKQKQFNQIFTQIISDSSLKSEDLLHHLKESNRLSALKAIQIYQEDYLARLTEALINTYPAIYYFIGNHAFYFLAIEFIKNHPSTSPDLGDYGLEMSQFLKNHPLQNDYPFLSAMASFEWSFKNIFHAFFERGNDFLELTESFEDESKYLQLVKSLELNHYNFLVHELSLLRKFPNEDHVLEKDLPSFFSPQSLIIYKKEQAIKIRVLTKNQFEIIEKFKRPCSLANALEDLSPETMPEEIQDLFEFLARERLLKF